SHDAFQGRGTDAWRRFPHRLAAHRLDSWLRADLRDGGHDFALDRREGYYRADCGLDYGLRLERGNLSGGAGSGGGKRRPGGRRQAQYEPPEKDLGRTACRQSEHRRGFRTDLVCGNLCWRRVGFLRGNRLEISSADGYWPCAGRAAPRRAGLDQL